MHSGEEDSGVEESKTGARTDDEVAGSTHDPRSSASEEGTGDAHKRKGAVVDAGASSSLRRTRDLCKYMEQDSWTQLQ